MEKQQISDDYLREFFGIRGDEEGNAELEEIKSRLVRLQFKHGEDICRIDDEADGMQQSPYGYEAYDEAGTFEEEEKAAGYYTYESTSTYEPYEAANPAKSDEPRRQAQAPRMAAMVADEPDEDAGQAFDLRQAIIYQTILHNKYNTALSLS